MPADKHTSQPPQLGLHPRNAVRPVRGPGGITVIADKCSPPGHGPKPYCRGLRRVQGGDDRGAGEVGGEGVHEEFVAGLAEPIPGFVEGARGAEASFLVGPDAWLVGGEGLERSGGGW